jgi:hypothetical protein
MVAVFVFIQQTFVAQIAGNNFYPCTISSWHCTK